MDILIKGGRLVDPSQNLDEVRNIYIKDGIVSDNDVKEGKLEELSKEAQVIDAKGLVVMPGLVDLHVHFRDPGLTYKETIRTGSMAAAAGGVTSVCTMPNTKPAADSVEVIKYQIEEGAKAGFTNVLPIAAITKGQDGEVLNDLVALKKAGAVAVSEDGKSVMDITLYREAMRVCAENDILVMAHCEDKNLVAGGVINAGDKQKELGLKGITNAVEDVITARDIFLAGETGARLHLCHCSTKGTVELTKLAGAMGYNVTAEVCPHHFTLSDSDITADDSKFKMNPPLRSKNDVEALIEGLADGTMKCISTDHAPHSAEEKKGGFNGSPFGIVGLETSFALSYTALVKSGKLSLMELVRKMSTNPADVLGINKGTLKNGAVADLFIADIDNEYAIDTSKFYSMGKNTPYDGTKVYGKVLNTILGGKMVYPFA